MLRAGILPAPKGFQKFLQCAFPGNARIVEHVSAIGFGGLMCLCATISIIIFFDVRNSKVLWFSW